MKSNICRKAWRYRIEKRRTCHHQSGEYPVTSRGMRLLFEIHDNSHFVCNGHPAARRVGDLAKAESCYRFMREMEFAHTPQICVGQNVGVENPKCRIRANPISICSQCTG